MCLFWGNGRNETQEEDRYMQLLKSGVSGVAVNLYLDLVSRGWRQKSLRARA